MPRPVLIGEPISRPPGSVLQFTPSESPMDAHLRAMMLLDDTAFPGYERYLAAMLPAAAADLSNCAVSYQPCAVADAASGLLSQLKKAKILFFQRGPPRLPPY